MGEAKRRGTYEERSAAASAKRAMDDLVRLEVQRLVEERRRAEWNALTPAQREARLKLAGMLATGMAVSGATKEGGNFAHLMQEAGYMERIE